MRNIVLVPMISIGVVIVSCGSEEVTEAIPEVIPEVKGVCQRNAEARDEENISGSDNEDTAESERFSFFVTSYKSITKLAGRAEGFGGDLRYGETTGLAGADKICSEIAELSMPGSAAKEWRAFLSAKKGKNGDGPVHAIERIGDGPWYDRLGRLVANNPAELQNPRPICADPAIRNDLPNEFGVPNSTPDGTRFTDNHHTMTGSTSKGMLYINTVDQNRDPLYDMYSTSDEENRPTCDDWTSSEGAGGPRVGLSWSRGETLPGSTFGIEWISEMFEGGCEPGFNFSGGTKDGSARVGSGGGYGQFYCFALSP